MRSSPAEPHARKAVCVSLASFGNSWAGLPFAPARSEALATALEQFGYKCSRITGKRTAAEIGTAVTEAIKRAGSADLLVVHVLSHGTFTESGSLRVVGADGKHHELSEVERWLKAVVDDNGPPTLFLLDLCGAGTAARMSWQTRITSAAGSRAWVIAACAPEEAAFDGRFTTAVSTILNELASGSLDIDPSFAYAPITTLAQRIRRRVTQLADSSKGFSQQVTGSLIDISADPVDLAFFPNRRYDSDPRRLVRLQLEPAIAPFLDDLDEALDPRFFAERASGSAEMTGCFSGRRVELKILAPWLNLQDDIGLRVVTGSPGVGKSALLGVLVCAAHPLLRVPTRTVWEHVEQAPYLNKQLAAVHARGRGLAQIVASVARQLSLVLVIEDAASLIEAIVAMPQPPVVIIDALDEANDGIAVMENLLLPLAKSKHANGEPVRLLVGTRPWHEFTELLEAARAQGGLTNLDEVPADRLRRDVEQYVSRLLTADERWDTLDVVGKAHTFARAVAETLTGARAPGQQWGAFLVAGLFAHHVLHTYAEPPADPVRLGQSVPLTLPDLLDLDLGSRKESVLLRRLLSILAHAKGEGMPAEILRSVSARELSIPDVIRALDDTRFYLRHSAGPDGTTLYRLFHQGLADHLKDVVPPAEIVDGLLASVAIREGDFVEYHWEMAEPYARRYAPEHAHEADRVRSLIRQAGFLVHADPAALEYVASLPLGDGRTKTILAVIQRIVTMPLTGSHASRRDVLMYAAAAEQDTQLLQSLKRVPGLDRPEWTPLWVQDNVSAATAAAAFSLRGKLCVALGFGNGEILVRGIDDDAADPHLRLNGSATPVCAIATGKLWGVDAVVARQGDNTVRIFNALSGEILARPLDVGHNPVHLSVGEVGGRETLLTVAETGQATLWDVRLSRRMTEMQVAAHGFAYGGAEFWCGLPSGLRTLSVGTKVSTWHSGPSIEIGSLAGKAVLYHGAATGLLSIVDAVSSSELASIDVGDRITRLFTIGDGTVVVCTSKTLTALRHSRAQVPPGAGLPLPVVRWDKFAHEKAAEHNDSAFVIPPIRGSSGKGRSPAQRRPEMAPIDTSEDANWRVAKDLLLEYPQIGHLMLVGRHGLYEAVYSNSEREVAERLSALAHGFMAAAEGASRVLSGRRVGYGRVWVPAGRLSIESAGSSLLVAFSGRSEDTQRLGLGLAKAAIAMGESPAHTDEVMVWPDLRKSIAALPRGAWGRFADQITRVVPEVCGILLASADALPVAHVADASVSDAENLCTAIASISGVARSLAGVLVGDTGEYGHTPAIFAEVGSGLRAIVIVPIPEKEFVVGVVLNTPPVNPNEIAAGVWRARELL